MFFFFADGLPCFFFSLAERATSPASFFQPPSPSWCVAQYLTRLTPLVCLSGLPQCPAEGPAAVPYPVGPSLAGGLPY